MSTLEETAIGLSLADAEATERLGADIALALKPGDCVWLHGDLGAGKTSLARGLIRAMIGAEIDVPSPTFTLVQPYEDGRVPVLHADLYRIENAPEIEELGFDEALRDGIVLVEWPERGMEEAATLHVELVPEGEGRAATIWGEALPRVVRSLEIRTFLAALGKGGVARAHLTGDASSRSYETLPDGSQRPRVVMNAPDMPDGPPLDGGEPYSRIAHLAETVRPFVAVGEALRKEGFAAPRIYAADLGAGLLLVENLGDGSIAPDGKPLESRYETCAALLADLHDVPWSPELDLPDGTTYDLPSYDRGAMRIEVSLLADWYARDVLGRELTHGERERFFALWDDLIERLPRETLVLRDYHSPNIVWRDEAEGHARVGLIDFQDAVMGPAAYDVASLAQDARVDVCVDLETRLVDRYCRARWPERAGDPVHEEVRFREAYAICAAQRASKILGIFVRLDLRDGKPGYRAHLPRMRDYVRRSLKHPALRELAEFYREAFDL